MEGVVLTEYSSKCRYILRLPNLYYFVKIHSERSDWAVESLATGIKEQAGPLYGDSAVQAGADGAGGGARRWCLVSGNGIGPAGFNVHARTREGREERVSKGNETVGFVPVGLYPKTLLQPGPRRSAVFKLAATLTNPLTLSSP